MTLIDKAALWVDVIVILVSGYNLCRLLRPYWIQKAMIMFKPLNKLVYWLTILPRLKVLKALLPEARIHPVGSRYTRSPPALFTDIDFLIYAENHPDDVLRLNGFVKSDFREYAAGNDMDHHKFSTYRRGKVNLIVTSDKAFAEAFQTATYLCKIDNIYLKFNRVTVHQVMRGNWRVKDMLLTPHSEIQHLMKLLATLTGPHGNTLHQAFRAQHGLEL